MGNRKLPFGYEIRMGEIRIRQEEEAVVVEVFRRYNSGASYKEIVDWLITQDVRYLPDRLWNKNMVARILEDRRYVGESDFSPIISADVLESAAQKRASKWQPSQITVAQKALQRLCSTRITESIEHKVLTLMNYLIKDPEQVRADENRPLGIPLAIELQRQLDAVMLIQPMDEDQARKLIAQIASAQYDEINSDKYETCRIRHLMTEREPMETLDAELVVQTVQAITVKQDKVTLILKNGQHVEGGRIE